MSTAEPRWAASQRAVEAALARGPLTIPEIVAQSGYSESAVRRAVQRDSIVELMSWPRRYALKTEAVQADPTTVNYVTPTEFENGEVGIRWQEGKLKFSKELAALDLTRLPLTLAREKFRAAAATILGVLVILDQVEDGPEWRSEIGL